MLNKEVNGYFAACLIIVAGFGFMGYVAFDIDWEKYEVTYLTISVPIFFSFFILATAFKAISTKDVDITSKETDQKISDKVDEFNKRTGKAQNIIFGIFFGAIILYGIAMLVWAYIQKGV